MYHFAKGFLLNGCDVLVICMRSLIDGLPAYTFRYGTTPDKIEFACCQEFTREPNFFLRQFWRLRASVRLLKLLQKIHSEKSIDFFICQLSEYLWLASLILVIARFLGVKCVCDKTEYPFVYHKRSYRTKLSLLFYQVICKGYDGFIVCSTMLRNYFLARVKASIPILIVPNLGEIRRRESATELIRTRTGPKAPKWIFYVRGSSPLTEVAVLIRAFIAIGSKCPGWSLMIVGKLDLDDLRDNYHIDFGAQCIKDRVVFAGFLNRDLLISKMEEADLFVLPRATGVFSSAGFPTKLVEYLSTGKPVITTPVGDIPLYLADGVSAYFLPSVDVGVVSEKIMHVISDPTDAELVGRAGLSAAVTHFDFIKNTAVTIRFLKRLQSRS